MNTPLASAPTIQEAEATVRPAPSQQSAPPARRKTLILRLDGFDRRRGVYAPRVSEQCRQALSAGVEALSAQGLSIADVIRVVYLVRDADAFSSCFPQLREAFGDNRPAATLRLVTGFAHPDIEIEIELVVDPAGGAPPPA